VSINCNDLCQAMLYRPKASDDLPWLILAGGRESHFKQAGALLLVSGVVCLQSFD
jgi:hypothetical protein